MSEQVTDRLSGAQIWAIPLAVERAVAELDSYRLERQGVIDCINLYGDKTLHDALDAAGLLMDGRRDD